MAYAPLPDSLFHVSKALTRLKSGMKRKLLGAAVILAAVLVLVAVTPIGPAALAHLLERGVGGWQVSIGSRRGGLLYAFSFSDVRCKNPALGVTVDAGVYRRVAVVLGSRHTGTQGADRARYHGPIRLPQPRTSSYPLPSSPTSTRQPVRSIGSWAKRESWHRTGTARIA